MKKTPCFSTILIVLFFILSPAICAQSQIADSLINVLNTQKLTAAEQLELYKNISANLSEADPRKSDAYATKGLVLAKKEKDKEKMALFYSYLGMSYGRSGDVDKGIAYLETALTLVQKTKNEKMEADMYANIASIYLWKSMIEESLQQYMKALSIYEKIGNKKSSMLVLSAIAGIHRMLNDYDRAIYYLEKSKVIAEELNDFNVLSRTYYELGAINMGNGAYDKALEQVLKAIEISHSNNWIIIETYAMYAAANVYIDGFQDFDQAEEYVKQALLMTEKYDIPAIVLELQLTLAKIHLGQKRYKDCDELASMVYEMDTVNIERRMNASLLIIDANIFLGNQAKASSFLNNYKNLVNQFNKDGLHQSLSEMEVKYETEKKDLRIADMEKEKVLYIWLGIVGGGLLLSLLILFIILHRLAVAKSKMCEQQVVQVEQEKQIVATQAALDGETAERTRMARDLHDGLGGLLSVVKLNLDDVEHLQNARDTLDKSIEELRRVAHHMMPESLLRYGLKAALEDFCLSAPNVQFDYFGDDSPIDDRTSILIYRCTYELVNNAIKYANATTIQVQLYQDTDRISLIVEDNGCGFDTETVETLKSDVSTGMGLGNLRARVAAGKGIMDISSSPGKGTEVHVKLPLS